MMNTYFKVIAGILISVIIGLILSRQGRDMWSVLTISVCCMILSVLLGYIQPVIAFFEQLTAIGNIDRELYGILLKCTGIGIVSEIASLLCNDSGNTAMGKGIQMLAVSVIIVLALPLFQELLNLIETVADGL